MNQSDSASQPSSLTHLKVINVTGRDAQDFLNRQFTNDVSLLNPNQLQFNGYCNHQGRLIASFWLVRLEPEQFLMITGFDAVDECILQLKKYVMRSKVIVEELNYQSLQGHIIPDDNLSSESSSVDKPINNTLIDKSDQRIKLDLSTDTFKRTLSIIFNNDANESKSVSINDWKYTDIQAKIPHVYKATQAKFVPQHVGFDELRAVNYKKGCYPGQEVVARLHYKGKSKKTARVIEVDKIYEAGDGFIDSSGETDVRTTIIDSAEHQGRFMALVSG